MASPPNTSTIPHDYNPSSVKVDYDVRLDGDTSQYSDSDTVSEDESDKRGEDYPRTNEVAIPRYSDGVIKFMNAVGDENDADVINPTDTVRSDMWCESDNEIRLSMKFESKAQLKKAITLWSMRQNREFKVVESRINTWIAKYKM